MGFFYRMYHQDSERAADDCQETFMKVWHTRHQYNADLAFRPWLYTIAYNISRSYFRQAELQEKYTAEQSLRYEETDSDDSELKIDQETIRKALSEALERLPSEQRTLFALRYEEELTVAQVSQILDMPEGTVKSRLHRMLYYLKHELKDYERI
jgi:RNA polymerase sigma-70 factor (ECF subfamily)